MPAPVFILVRAHDLNPLRQGNWQRLLHGLRYVGVTGSVHFCLRLKGTVNYVLPEAVAVPCGLSRAWLTG
jgi:hypothetical protein